MYGHATYKTIVRRHASLEAFFSAMEDIDPDATKRLWMTRTDTAHYLSCTLMYEFNRCSHTLIARCLAV